MFHKKTILCWSNVADTLAEHGPLTVEGLAKVTGRKVYEMKTIIVSMRANGYVLDKDTKGRIQLGFRPSLTDRAVLSSYPAKTPPRPFD